jgi:predicted ATPase with chaperone activity
MPSEVPLADYGAFVLDARPAFRRHVLEVLSQSLEEGLIYI